MVVFKRHTNRHHLHENIVNAVEDSSESPPVKVYIRPCRDSLEYLGRRDNEVPVINGV